MRKVLSYILATVLVLTLILTNASASFHKKSFKVKAQAQITSDNDGAGTLVKGSSFIRAVGSIKDQDVDKIVATVKLYKLYYFVSVLKDVKTAEATGVRSLRVELDGMYTAQKGWKVEATGYVIKKDGERVDAKADTKLWGGKNQSVNQPPVSDPNGPYSGIAGEEVVFDGSGSYDPDLDGEIVSYLWDFGDGKTGTGIKPSHVYAERDEYIVSLTVTDDAGATDTTQTTAKIETLQGGEPTDFISPRDDRGFEWWGETSIWGVKYQCGANYSTGVDAGGRWFYIEDLFVRWDAFEPTFIRKYWGIVKPSYESNHTQVDQLLLGDSGWKNAGTFNIKIYSQASSYLTAANLQYSTPDSMGTVYVSSCMMYLPFN